MFKFNFFSKKETNANQSLKDDCVDEKIKTDAMTLEEQVEWIQKKGWIHSDFDVDRKNILIMDDSSEIISSLIDDLEELDETTFDIYDFNLITVSSKMAGFHVLEILEKAPDIDIDFALLDIILGGKKTVNNKRTMVDGVDVAIQLWKHNPQTSILFFSGCIIESSNDSYHFKTRFDNFTGEDINNYVLPKATSFDSYLEKLTNLFMGL